MRRREQRSDSPAAPGCRRIVQFRIGEPVVTWSNDNTARVWDAATGAPIGQPLHHESIVVSAKFSPDGERVVTDALTNRAALRCRHGRADWPALSTRGRRP